MAITDLTNTTWKFNDSLDFSGSNVGGQTFTISFSSANANNSAIVTYLRIGFGGWTSSMQMYIDYYPSTTTTFHNRAVLRGEWQNEGYKIITFTGGTDATNATLISWLQSNATQVTLVNSTTLETTLHTAGKYCNKNILVKSSDSNLIAENIKKDVSVFGVTGSYAGTDVSDTTATQGDVLSGKYFYGSDGVKTEGTMTNHTESEITLNAGTGDQYVPAGHYSDILTKLVLNSDAASKIKQGEVILGVTGTFEGGGDQPQLNPPAISIAGTTLSIEDPATNGNFTSGWKLYDNGAYVDQFLTAVIQLDNIQFSTGTHKLTVKSFGTNFKDSVASNEVTYQITEKLATPQNVTADGTTVSWDVVENATSYAVLADGSEIGTVEGGGGSSGYTVTITEVNAAGTYSVYINGESIPRDLSTNIRVFHNVKTFNIECQFTGNRLYNATGSLTNVSWSRGFAYSKDIDITEDSSASLDTDQ